MVGRSRYIISKPTPLTESGDIYDPVGYTYILLNSIHSTSPVLNSSSIACCTTRNPSVDTFLTTDTAFAISHYEPAAPHPKDAEPPVYATDVRYDQAHHELIFGLESCPVRNGDWVRLTYG